MVSRATIIGNVIVVVLVFLCVLFGVASYLTSSESCEPPIGGNPLGKFLYHDLKCSPIFDGSHAITSYNCSGIIKEGQCIFEGEKMKFGDSIKNIHTDVFCKSSCPCDEKGNFNCLTDDCDRMKIFYHIGTRKKYNTTQCCFELVSAAAPSKFNCTMGNETFIDGDIMRHDDTCSSCICQEGFTGRIEKPYCVKRRCLQQIVNPSKIAKSCAAVYHEKDQCCPKIWICNEHQQIVKMSNSSISKPGLFCDFGSDEVPYGHGFETKMKIIVWNAKVRCECTLPPFLTCIFHYTEPLY